MSQEEYMEMTEEDEALEEFEKKREAEWKIYEDRYEDWY